MIEVNQLSKHFGRFVAVNNISFRAEAGQITGFLGPNGAGKTTTMRMLTGYLPPTQGQATVAGYDVFDESMAVRQHVGYLPETVPLYRDMTVSAYLRYLAEIRGIAERQQRTDAVIEQVGLSARHNSRISTLSKGMRQRVGLAGALIHNPPVLILDEPTIGLDPLQVLELRQIVRDLRTERTVLFSTHILSEAEQICDHIVILNRGEVVAQGSPATLRQQLQRGGRLLVRVGGDASTEANALRILRQLRAVQQAKASDDALIVVPRPKADDINQQVAQALIDAKIPLLELRPLAVTLEEIFIEFTRESAPDAGILA